MTTPHPLSQDRILLGTAQLGSDYGVFGTQETTKEAQARVDQACQLGFRNFDTAPAYGSAEEILGLSAPVDASVVTKTVDITSALPAAEMTALIGDGLQQSLKRLQRDHVQGLLLHQPETFDRSVRAALESCRSKGLARQIGISVYDGVEIDRVLADWTPDIIQLPLSILDQRLIKSGHIQRLQDLGVEIHIRSAFLQGLLLATPNAIPTTLKALRDPISALADTAEQLQVSRLSLCLGFLAKRIEHCKLVIGLQNQGQLAALVEALKGVVMPADPEQFCVTDPQLVNPALWRL